MFFRSRSGTARLFGLFEKLMVKTEQCGDYFRKVINTGDVSDNELKKMRDYEHECDRMTYSIIEALNTRIRLPFAVETMHTLAHEIDNIVDSIYAVIKRIKLYKMKTDTRYLMEFADIVVQTIESAGKAVNGLGGAADNRSVQGACKKVTVLKNAGDQLRDTMTERLFSKTKDPIRIIQSKEVYEGVDSILDAAERVTRTVESILLRKS